MCWLHVAAKRGRPAGSLGGLLEGLAAHCPNGTDDREENAAGAGEAQRALAPSVDAVADQDWALRKSLAAALLGEDDDLHDGMTLPLLHGSDAHREASIS